VKQYAVQYWKVAKQANQMYDEYEKIKASEKYSVDKKESMLKE
jgi:hypothetical protein